MPNRILREGIIESEAVNALSSEAELFYRRLMSKVDDYGRFHGDAELVRAACYPRQLDKVSAQDVRNRLAECARDVRALRADGGQLPAHDELPLISLFEVRGKKYLQINNFGQRERTGSKFPAPCAQNDRVMTAQCAQPADIPRLAHAHSESEAYSYSEASAESDARATAVLELECELAKHAPPARPQNPEGLTRGNADLAAMAKSVGVEASTAPRIGDLSQLRAGMQSFVGHLTRTTWKLADMEVAKKALAACRSTPVSDACEFLRREAFRKRGNGAGPVKVESYGFVVKLLEDHFREGGAT